jgi:TPR repeat protein
MARLRTLAERPRLFATRTSKPALWLALLLLSPGLALGAGTLTFKSSEDALKQGVSAFNGGYYEIAIPALQFAAQDHQFLAQYYLAKIYADNTGAHTDHAKAYTLFQGIVDEHAEIDPEDDPRARYVGKALTALAGYVLNGLKEIGLKSDPERAAEYLHNASVSFDDEDAQFELAKLQLKGQGVDEDIPRGRHWLARLAQKGHAGAQAFLADLLWRGMYMEKDQPRALALIAVAVDNAPPTERLWIEDIYQNIYCGAGEGVRKQATGIVAEWGNRYGRKPEYRDRTGLGTLVAQPVRACHNGDLVVRLDPDGKPVEQPAAAAKPEMRFLQGGASAAPGGGTASGPALRDVGAGFAPE